MLVIEKEGGQDQDLSSFYTIGRFDANYRWRLALL